MAFLFPMPNPLLLREKLPRFDLIQPEHVEEAVSIVLKRSEEALLALESQTAEDWGYIEKINEIEYDLSRTWGPVGHLMGVKNSDALRAAYEAMQPKIVDFFLRLGQSKALYENYKGLLERKGTSLSPAKRRALELRIREAEHSGIALGGEKKERFNFLARELSRLGTEFSNHVLDATKAWHLDLTDTNDVAGFPSSLLAQCAESYAAGNNCEADAKNGPWRVTLDLPCFLPLMQNAENRDLRKQVYFAYIERASQGELDNHPLIEKILRLRRELAALLGFSNYAELSLDSKMASSTGAVEDLLLELLDKSYGPAKQELEELRAFAKERGFGGELAHWDIAFYAERQREALFGFTDEDLRPYFPLERVLDGLFSLAGRLFGIRIEEASNPPPLWHPDVKYFHVLNESGAQIASFYLDPYSRPEEKRGGAWMDDCISRWRHGNSLELPVAYLVCNGTPPLADRPSLMSFREVETLFHEFGHGLQHMLTQVDELDVSGIGGVEWDAVELPSQFMENWCYHKPTLLGFSAHYKTGEPLPDDLFEKIKRARTFRSASAMLRQLRFSMLDMRLHTDWNPESGLSGIRKIEEEIHKKTSLLPPLPNDHFLCSFSHIFAGGYAAGYYSYKWAEVLSADAFAAFEEAGLEDEEALAKTGLRFRDTVLALGGSRHPREVFWSFRGREPKIEPLLRHSGLLEEGGDKGEANQTKQLAS